MARINESAKSWAGAVLFAIVAVALAIFFFLSFTAHLRAEEVRTPPLGFTTCIWENYDQPNDGTTIYVSDTDIPGPANFLWEFEVLNPTHMATMLNDLPIQPLYACATHNILGEESNCGTVDKFTPFPQPLPPKNFQCLSNE